MPVKSKTATSKNKPAPKEETQEYDATLHVLSPKHEKLSDVEITELLKTFNVEYAKLPKISLSDPAIENFEAKLGDVIKITRPSPTTGTTVYYRMAIEQ